MDKSLPRLLRNAINNGKTIKMRLNEIGVYTLHDLEVMTPVNAFKEIRANYLDKTIPVCYYLFSLQGALMDTNWTDLPVGLKKELLLRVDKIKMYLLFSFIILISLPILSCQQERIALGERESFTIESHHTDHSYSVDVRLPFNYNQNKIYSTIYILDSDWYFRTASEGAAKQTMDANHKGVIVIGIRTNNSRSADFTPTATSQGEGGASEFKGFLNDELIPEIEKKYSVAKNSNRRAIIGHSLGGLFAVYLFVHHNDLFNNYYALSPSLWYDEALILKDEKDMRAQNQETSNNVFISFAELEPAQLFIEIFSERIASHYPNIVSKKFIVKGKNHSSSADIAITEAIEFHFDNLEGID